MQQHAEYPEQFFTSLKAIEQRLGERNLFATLQPEVEAILSGYFSKNGNYRSNELLRAVYTASSTPAAGTALILSLANAAPDPNLLLEDFRRANWIAPESREAILQRQIALARNHSPATEDSSPAGVAGYQRELVRLYLDHNQLDQAQAVLDSIAASPFTPAQDEDRILLAVRTGHLERLLDTWRANPDSVPSQTTLNSTLYYLRRPTPIYTPNPAQIRPLQEFVFDRKQLAHTLVPTDFVALAQARLDTNDLPGALDLLRRLTLQPTSSYETGRLTFAGPDAESNTLASDPSMIGQPPTIAYDGSADDASPSTNIDYAAALLERTHHPAEALPFLTMLVNSAPWNATFRLRLAEAQRDASHRAAAIPLLNRVLTDASAPYATRASAATDLRAFGAAPASSASPELILLASSSPTPASVRQPYFDRARIALAAQPNTPAPDRTILLREAIAITPTGPLADQARLNLLLLAGDNDPPASILTLLANVQRAQTPAPDTPQAEAPDQPPTEVTENPPAPDSTIPNLFLPPLANALPLPTRLHLAQLLSSAYQRDQQTFIALGYAQLAVKLSEPHPDPALLRRRDELHAAVTLDRLNVVRRPVLPHHARPAQPGPSPSHRRRSTPSRPRPPGAQMTRSRLLALCLSITALAAWGLQAATHPRRPTLPAGMAALLPPGALLTIESPDFAALLASWNASPEQRAWLTSDNHSVFSNSRLFGRLNDARTEFEGAAAGPKSNQPPSFDAAFLTSIAGRRSIFAWYDIGNLEFVYVTHLAPGQSARIALLQSRAAFTPRRIGQQIFYMRRGAGSEQGQARTVAFAEVTPPRRHPARPRHPRRPHRRHPPSPRPACLRRQRFLSRRRALVHRRLRRAHPLSPCPRPPHGP